MTKRRSGYSLIEITAVMGVCSVLAGIAVWLVHVSLQSTRAGQCHLVEQKSIARLAEIFRRDVRAAVSIVQDPGDEGADIPGDTIWKLHLASGSYVCYQLKPSRLTRDVLAADAKIVSTHETFELRPGARVEIVLEPPSVPHIASLLISADQIEPDADDRTPNLKFASVAAPAVRIDAVVSLDRRFEQIAMIEKELPESMLPEKGTGEKTVLAEQVEK